MQYRPDITKEYEDNKKQIQDKVFKNIYSNFEFKYYSLSRNNENDDQKENQKEYEQLIEYLKTFKFVVFKHGNCRKDDAEINRNWSYEKKSVICVEKECIIIESENISFIIDQLKESNIFILEDKYNIKKNPQKKTRPNQPEQNEHLENKPKETQENQNKQYQQNRQYRQEVQMNEEIRNFCSNTKICDFVRNNDFVRTTITTIVGYLIRRHYHPTEYFKCPTFFNIHEQGESSESALFNEIKQFLTNSPHQFREHYQGIYDIFARHIKAKAKEEKESISEQPEHKQTNDKEQDSKPTQDQTQKYRQFQEEEFIKLRTLGNKAERIKDNFVFDLVIHLETLQLFVMKKYPDKTQYHQEIESSHETYFCRHFSHRCFMRFEGFLTREGQIFGYIYEFLSNGSLEDYMKNNQGNIDYEFKIMTMIRIFEGLEYLHSQKLIHRDLKPLNILLDHDYIPYIIDFETIRHPIADEVNKNTNSFEITNDIGSIYYSSPEQDSGSDISYPTDIYSFGFIIYFIFNEGNIPTNLITNDNKKIGIKLPLLNDTSNITEHIQYLCENCYKAKKEERLSHEEIRRIINNNIISKHACACPYEYGNENAPIESTIFQYMYEIIDIQDKSTTDEIMKCFENMFSTYLYLYKKILHDDSIFYLKLGNFYSKEYKIQINSSTSQQKISNQEIANKYYFHLQDYSKSKKYYKISSKMNSPKAQVKLGQLYLDGQGVEQDYSKAKKYFDLSVESKHPKAYFNLGLCYFLGKGVKQNYFQAKINFKLSKELNESSSLLMLGLIYENGFGVPKNMSKAQKYYNEYESLKGSEAYNTLGNFYFSGIGVQQDFSKAKKYFEISASQNDSNAIFHLGIIYENGFGVKQDFLKAKEYYEESSKLNNHEALVNLGNLYLHGYGVEKDYLKAKKYYIRSAEEGNSNAFINLGILYEKGFGVEQSYLKAKEYYEKSSKMNNYDALIKLGYLYRYGLGVKQDYLKAKEYFDKSARFNNPNAIGEIGNLYFYGQGVEKNYLKAKEYYEKTVQFNNSYSIVNLGIIYEYGYGVKPDYQTARKYYEISARLNNSEALFRLGKFYLLGYGVKQSY